jgi:hypothetical protein
MDLGFQNIAEREFEYLQSEYRYKCIESGPWLIKYSSRDVFVIVSFDGNRSYELSCAIGRNDDYRDSCSVPFDLAEIIRCKEYPQKGVDVFCRVTSRVDLEKHVKELAYLLKAYAKDMLMGPKKEFDMVADFRNAECEKYYLQKEWIQLQEEVSIAWKNRLYKKVFELLSPHKEYLSNLDMKRLEYAKKMVEHYR